MLTAKVSEADRVVGLEMGADDYLTKPFSPRELVARVKAILRRAEMQNGSQAAEVYDKGALKINFATYEVVIRGKPARLTLKEFELLRFLVQNPNRVLTRDQLLDRVWGGDVFVDPRTVDVHIRRLRIALNGHDHADVIRTVRAAGYALDAQG
jgi:two-component system phosphate regulon response regulator PhoB